MSDQVVLAANLTRLSKVKRLSQQKIADATGIHQSKVGRIMRGSAAPDTPTLRAWAKMLGVKMQDLFVPVPQLTHIRFRSKKDRVNVRQEVLVTVAAWLRNYQELEHLRNDTTCLSINLRFTNRREKPEQAAERIRHEMGIKPDEPIFDICGLLEAKGIKVCALPKFSDAFFGLSVAAEDGGPAVVVNCNPQISVERWIFSAAHELGHLALHPGSFQADQKNEIDSEEAEANQFAGHFLMPQMAFSKVWEASKGLHPVDRVVKVKRHFAVSYLSVLHRLVATKRSTPRVYQSFAMLYKKRTGKSLKGHHEMDPIGASSFRSSLTDEPMHLSHSDFQPERLARLVREALDEQQISVSKAADIMGISLEAMRELMAAWVDDLVVN